MPRNSQLVCQHLENVSRELLEEYQDLVRQYVGRRHGVYALYRKNRLYYVGLASELRRRLKQHLKDQHGDSWDRFSLYITIGDQHLRELESLILRITAPKGNKQRGKLKKSENLRKLLSRDIRRRYRLKLQALFGRLEPQVIAIKRRRNGHRNGRVLLCDLVSKPYRLMAENNGVVYKARLRRDGTIRFSGKIFKTPSGAGKAALKRAVDGWTFWKYLRAPGDWVELDDLRRGR